MQNCCNLIFIYKLEGMSVHVNHVVHWFVGK